MFALNRRKSYVVLLLGSIAAFASCYPNGPESVQEFDTVVTARDRVTDFGPLTTYAMPDTVLSITGENGEGEEHDRSNDAQILVRIRQNMDDAGFTEIAIDLDNNPPDMLIVVGIATFKNYNAYSTYPWYGGWGGYGGWNVGFPWYSSSVVYSYRVGTLIALMVDGRQLDQQPDNVSSMWVGAANGLLETGPSQTTQRVNEAIDQMWTQSPYLQKGN